MESKYKHLEMIQATITRMASNSFQLKGLLVTIIAALIALSVVKSNQYMYLLMALPTIAFWILDAYYLRQEKLFRALYDDVRQISKDEDINFSMNTSAFSKKVKSLTQCVFCSGSTIGFYLPFLLFSLALFFIASSCGHPELLGG